MAERPSFAAVPDLMRDIGVGIGNAAAEVVRRSRSAVGTLAVKDADVSVEFEMTSAAVSTQQGLNVGVPLLGAKTLSVGTVAARQADTSTGRVTIRLHIVAIADVEAKDKSEQAGSGDGLPRPGPVTRPGLIAVSPGGATGESARLGDGGGPPGGAPVTGRGTVPPPRPTEGGIGRRTRGRGPGGRDPNVGGPATTPGEPVASPEALRELVRQLSGVVRGRGLPASISSSMLSELEMIDQMLRDGRTIEAQSAITDFATRYAELLG